MPTTLDEHVLACVCHGTTVTVQPDPRVIPVQLDPMRGPGVELWTSPTPVRRGEDDGIRYAENGTVLFGQMHIPESRLADIERESLHAYAQLDGFLRRHGYPAWLRVWNFMAWINRGDGDDERYRQFVLGRYKALALKPGFERELPAATAIGTYGEGLTIYFMAGKHPGHPLENPRQVSAFRYPRAYGPRSPSFARAMYMPWTDQPELLLSGTASVVGHETLHAGRPRDQLRETFANIDALLAHAQSEHLPAGDTRWAPQHVKLYLRDPSLFDSVWPLIEQHYGDAVPVTVLHGDVCRTDLSLEIEAVFRAQP